MKQGTIRTCNRMCNNTTVKPSCAITLADIIYQQKPIYTYIHTTWGHKYAYLLTFSTQLLTCKFHLLTQKIYLLTSHLNY